MAEGGSGGGVDSGKDGALLKRYVLLWSLEGPT